MVTMSFTVKDEAVVSQSEDEMDRSDEDVLSWQKLNQQIQALQTELAELELNTIHVCRATKPLQSWQPKESDFQGAGRCQEKQNKRGQTKEKEICIARFKKDPKDDLWSPLSRHDAVQRTHSSSISTMASSVNSMSVTDTVTTASMTLESDLSRQTKTDHSSVLALREASDQDEAEEAWQEAEELNSGSTSKRNCKSENVERVTSDEALHDIHRNQFRESRRNTRPEIIGHRDEDSSHQHHSIELQNDLESERSIHSLQDNPLSIEQQVKKSPHRPKNSRREAHFESKQGKLFPAKSKAFEPKDETDKTSRLKVPDTVATGVKAFDFFSMISIDETEGSIENKTFTQAGSRYLDAFICSAGDVMDVYPNEKHQTQELSVIVHNFDLRARLLPRVALERAASLAWIGKAADTVQFVSLTNGPNETKSGIAIIRKELVDTVDLVERLSCLRLERRAAVVIARWWKERKASGTLHDDSSITKMLTNATMSEAEAENGKLDAQISEQVLKEPSGEKRAIFSTEDQSCLISTLGNFSRSLASLPLSLFCAEAHPSEKPANSTRRNIKIIRTVKKFLKSSPLPMYDSEKGCGVWTKAKLKRCRFTGGMYIVLKTAPSSFEDSAEFSPFELQVKLEEERRRLMEMVKGIRLYDTPEQFPIVTKVIFKKCKLVLKDKSDDGFSLDSTSTLRTTASMKYSTRAFFSQDSRVLANEAYEEMVNGEKMGDVCIVERCYVLVGGKEQELSLLLASLQHLVNSEREENSASQCSFRSVGSGGPAEKSFHFNRHDVLRSLQTRCILKDTLCVSEQLTAKRERKAISLPLPGVTTLKLPWPIPEITCTWALGVMLLRLGSDIILEVLDSLLREQSLLVLGRSTCEVSACVMALRELLKPFVWRGTFAPLLPASSCQLTMSARPFLVGMAVDVEHRQFPPRCDSKLSEALSNGKVVLNLTSGTLENNANFGEDGKLSKLYANLRESTQKLETRLTILAESPDSWLMYLKCKDCASTMASLQSFIHRGPSQDEIDSIHAVRSQLFTHLEFLRDDLQINKASWERCGSFDYERGRFCFDENAFLQTMYTRMRLMQDMARTKMFSDMINSYAENGYHNEELRMAAGQQITNWLFLKKEARKVECRLSNAPQCEQSRTKAALAG